MIRLKWSKLGNGYYTTPYVQCGIKIFYARIRNNGGWYILTIADKYGNVELNIAISTIKGSKIKAKEWMMQRGAEFLDEVRGKDVL